MGGVAGVSPNIVTERTGAWVARGHGQTSGEGELWSLEAQDGSWYNIRCLVLLCSYTAQGLPELRRDLLRLLHPLDRAQQGCL